jgi:hypothetical protein
MASVSRPLMAGVSPPLHLSLRERSRRKAPRVRDLPQIQWLAPVVPPWPAVSRQPLPAKWSCRAATPAKMRIAAVEHRRSVPAAVSPPVIAPLSWRGARRRGNPPPRSARRRSAAAASLVTPSPQRQRRRQRTTVPPAAGRSPPTRIAGDNTDPRRHNVDVAQNRRPHVLTDAAEAQHHRATRERNVLHGPNSPRNEIAVRRRRVRRSATGWPAARRAPRRCAHGQNR